MTISIDTDRIRETFEEMLPGIKEDAGILLEDVYAENKEAVWDALKGVLRAEKLDEELSKRLKTETSIIRKGILYGMRATSRFRVLGHNRRAIRKFKTTMGAVLKEVAKRGAELGADYIKDFLERYKEK